MYWSCGASFRSTKTAVQPSRCKRSIRPVVPEQNQNEPRVTTAACLPDLINRSPGLLRTDRREVNERCLSEELCFIPRGRMPGPPWSCVLLGDSWLGVGVDSKASDLDTEDNERRPRPVLLVRCWTTCTAARSLPPKLDQQLVLFEMDLSEAFSSVADLLRWPELPRHPRHRNRQRFRGRDLEAGP